MKCINVIGQSNCLLPILGVSLAGIRRSFVLITFSRSYESRSNSRVKALKNITYGFKREFLHDFKVKNAAVNYLRRVCSRQNLTCRLQIRPQGPVT